MRKKKTSESPYMGPPDEYIVHFRMNQTISGLGIEIIKQYKDQYATAIVTGEDAIALFSTISSISNKNADKFIFSKGYMIRKEE